MAVALAALMAVPGGVGAAPEEPAQETLPSAVSGEGGADASRVARERRAVQALAAGLDASQALAALRREGAAPDRAPLPSTDDAGGALLQGALEELAARAPAGGDGSGDAALTAPARAGRESGAQDESGAAWSRFLAADLLLRDGFADARRRLTDAGLPGAMLLRLDEAEAHYESTVDAVHRGGPEGAASAARALVRPPAPAVLGVGGLPFRRPELAPRAPRTAPTVRPVYLDPGDPAPAAADRAGSPTAPLAAEIVERARQLDYDAVRIYEYVRNGIGTELYAGSRRGALGTLRAGAGNDVDQASLLVALLRAASLPARFVHGVVELPVDGFAADLGLDPADVPRALARAGVAQRPVVRGGRVAAVEVEHTWVAARVPYGNYRGTLVDPSSPAWVPLAPAIKGHALVRPSGVLARAGLTSDQALDHFLSEPRAEEPLGWLRRRVEEWLAAEAPGETYPGQLGSRAVTPLALGLLPSTLPAPVVAVTGEAAELAPEHLPTLRVVVRGGGGRLLLDYTLPLHQAAGRRLTLSSTPATVDDDRVVHLWGGLDSVPAYLVRLRPRLRLDGRPLAVGEGDVAMGAEQSVELTLAGPWGQQTVRRQRIAGAYQALVVGGGQTGPLAAGGPEVNPSAEPDPADGEGLAARLLFALGAGYGERWSAAEDEIADLVDVALVRPWPSIAVVTDEVEVAEAGGLPLDLAWRGVTLDALVRAAEPLARAGAAAGAEPGTPADPEREWMRLAALHGSALEHRVFEDEFLVEAVSADLGLALARRAGIEVLRLDADNLAAELPRLADHPDVVRADVERRVGLGRVVEIPLRRIAVEAWTGSVWRAEDPVTGSAGYFIAGALAGGATTEAPGSWVLELLAQALAAPYSSAPNTDAGGGARVAKVLETDRQRGTVGRRLEKRLTVRVTDATGRPVQGASVTFRVWSGGGSLLDPEGIRTSILPTRTDRLGLASAPFVPGTDTGEDPVYVSDPGGVYPTRSGANLVEAVAASRQGDLVLDEAFVAYGFPAEPHTLRRTDTHETHFQTSSPGLWTDTLRLTVEDRYGNPISNQPLQLSTAVETTDGSCANPPEEPILPAAVFDPGQCTEPTPRLGECGAPEMVLLTRSDGVAAGVIPGDSAVSSYAVTVDHATLEPLVFVYAPVYTQDGSGSCQPLERFAVRARQSFNAEGELINAAEVGTTFVRPVEVQLFYWRPHHGFVLQPDGGFEDEALAQGSWELTEADRVEMTVDNGGSATDPAWDATRQAYRSVVTVGPAPARNRVTARVEGLHYLAGDTWRTWPEPLVRTVSAVWGVDLAILGATPAPIPLTDEGRSAEELTLAYGVAPGEYRASSAEVLLFESGREAATAVGSSRIAGGTVTVQRGFTFDRDERYTARVVLNRGGFSDVRSPAFELPLTQRLFRDVSPSVVISQEVDLVNQRACGQPDLFRFGLNRAATVSLVLRGVERRPDGATVEDGSEWTLIDGRSLAEGDHEEPVSPADVPPGEYRYVLTGTAADGATETRSGFVRSLFRERDSLPVGHVMVDGVDLFDGHLVLSRTDFEVPGRGLPLSFTRTFSSPSAGEPGPVGAGWTHNWDSRVVATPCGELIVIGGDGSGARFVDDGEGGLRPLRGHHGSLVVDEETLGLDYFSRAGVRYHYTPGGEGWDLAFVEDTSGNRTTLTYEDGAGSPGARRLAAVADEAGRRLRFTWDVRSTVRGPAELIVAVEGPGGLRVDLDYDEWGHAVRASREPHGDGRPSRVESYTWELRPEHAYDDLHVLTAVRDEVGGGVTRYDWDLGSVGVQGNVTVPRAFVTRVTRPEGGEVAFAYDPAALSSRQPAEVGVAVTGPRGHTTAYTLNQYGAPLAIEDPEGGLTRTEWVPGRALIAARIDPNGVRTDYGYDEHGNLLTESVEVTDFDGASRRLTRTRTFHPPESFEPPYVKNRVATSTDRTGATTRFEYDSAGRLVLREIDVHQADGGNRRSATSRTWNTAGDLASETGPRGHTTRYTYDAYGYPATVTDPLGGVTARTWDVRGRLLATSDALGRETGYRYDTLGRRVETRLPPVAGETEGPVEEVRYDDVARTVTQVDALGRESRQSFDREGRVVERRNAAGGIQVVTYDAAGLKVSESTWHDAATPRHDHTFAYDRAGRRVSHAEPLGRLTETVYDAAGNAVRETLSDAGDPGFVPRVLEHDYDELGRRVETRRQTDGGAAVTRTRYDGEGRPLEVVDPLGRSTLAEYDELGREIVRSEPPWRPGQRRVTTFVHDDAGNLVEERLDNDPVARVRTSSYDALGRRVSQTDGTGGTTHFDYDAVGNLVRRIDPRLDVVTYAYDARDRRISEVVHLDRVSQPARRAESTYGHDAVGNRTSETWPNGNAVTHTYDALDRRVESRDSLGLLSRTEYDARGNRIAEVDGEGRRTEIDYDALDRAGERRAPLGRVTAWTWDVAGNRLSETDPRGFETRFTYDRLDRLVEETDALGGTTVSAYDLAGNLLSRTDRRGYTSGFEYDALDRLVRTVDPAPLSTETRRTYDAAGGVLTETDRRGIVTETAYDAEGRPTEVRRAGVLLERRDYDAAGNLRFLTDANGHTTGYEYDERGLRLAENRPLGAITRWTYDDLGDVVEERDPEGRVTTRTYDLRRRPVAETDPAGATTAWTYDLVGNRLSERRPEGNTWTYAYDAADRLAAVTDPLGAETAYSYDPGGNLLAQTDANGHTTRFTYDDLSRRTARIYPDGAREELSYDAEGNLSARVDPAGQETAYQPVAKVRPDAT